ncbi:MAG: DEAD/DEAH box helicase [Actinobacteria bacterium]|nr:DEAD/DEAH box helicase [Actinomycetota bacterium]
MGDGPRELVDEFQRSYGFRFDDFQGHACGCLAGGSSVLVAAPTGSGKTVVGEFAAWLALRGGGKAFYTTPIKALSNQKYNDFLALHGAGNVGLLTGDNSINGDASIVVMTTEVLRNMIYENSPELSGLRYVVLDEVHYLQDPYRGAVWEEVLIHLPVEVQMISLSATVSNAEEFGEWLQTLRGRTEVIIEERRPVELRHWYFVADQLLPMFVHGADGTPIPNPRGAEFDRRRHRGPTRPTRGDRRHVQRRARVPYRSDVVDRLDDESMLPAIYFIFSRKGCDAAVRQCIDDGVRLTDDDARQRIIEYADLRVAELDPDELDVLGYDSWIAGLARGIAAHHAGMIPPFKETVEELFVRGLIKVVFATETLALGINMPARSVVIENLVKFTGEQHELMQPGEYTQLAGRAGRRGIDEIGHSLVLYQRFTPFDAITRLASTRTYPLISSFRPSYNMSVNLVRNYDQAEAEHLVNSSFGQFQTDRAVVELEITRERLDGYLASYRDRMHCELGDVAEYKRLLDRLDRVEGGGRRGVGRAAKINEALAALRAGDVIDVFGGKRRGRYVVLGASRGGRGGNLRVQVVSEQGSSVRLGAQDFRLPPRPIGKVRVPRDLEPRDARARKNLARRLSDMRPLEPREPAADSISDELRSLREAVEGHPVNKCPDITRHLHYAERAARLERDIRGIDRRIGRRAGTLARRFEKVLSVLETLRYVESWQLTEKGVTLARVYNESDLLVIEALESDTLADLDAAELAAICSTLVYETRGPETVAVGPMPTPGTRRAWKDLLKLWRDIRREEEPRGLELTREPDPGFADVAYRWASGVALEDVLGEEDAPGDFVRSTKQLVDLLRQLEEIAPSETLAATIREAIDNVHRGVVAYSSVEL